MDSMMTRKERQQEIRRRSARIKARLLEEKAAKGPPPELTGIERYLYTPLLQTYASSLRAMSIPKDAKWQGTKLVGKL